MKIKALSAFRGDQGTIRRGAEIDVPDAYGKALVKRGRAVELSSEDAKPPEKRPHHKAKGAAAPSEGE